MHKEPVRSKLPLPPPVPPDSGGDSSLEKKLKLRKHRKAQLPTPVANVEATLGRFPWIPVVREPLKTRVPLGRDAKGIPLGCLREGKMLYAQSLREECPWFQGFL